MGQEKIKEAIAALEREIAILPEGSLSKKTIKGKEYFYHRTTEKGKRKEKYVRFEDAGLLSEEIKKRKILEKKLKELKSQVSEEEEKPSDFKTTVRIGLQLKRQIEIVRGYRKRECIQQLRDYLWETPQGKVFILYGLRRTGKTTMIRQVLTEFSEPEFEKAAFIQVKTKDTLADVDADLRLLEEKGYRYIFIDEVTLLEDFVEGAALFSDIYAGSGMKIVLSGTDSLGFAFSKGEQLYDRCILLHTTFIPYREFEEVLGLQGIDTYIRYGGTMSPGGVCYNADTAEEYVNTAIAKNIQHSLRMYEYGSHFRHLQDLYDHGELTNVINRVVENINHQFTRKVIESTFESHDILVTAKNLLKDREHPMNLKEHMNIDAVTRGIMRILDILNKEDQSVEISDAHIAQIREYLLLLDLIKEIDLEYLPVVEKNDVVTVITQPGLRYAQAEAAVENMLLDAKLKDLSAEERQRVLNRLLSEICGRMTEEIVLLETKMAKPGKKVFKLQFPVGEFDMVVCDSQALTCAIYEVKYSRERTPQQYQHLINAEKRAMTEHRYGKITGRYVIYRGPSMEDGGIMYLNVEEYLKSL